MLLVLEDLSNLVCFSIESVFVKESVLFIYKSGTTWRSSLTLMSRANMLLLSSHFVAIGVEPVFSFRCSLHKPFPHLIKRAFPFKSGENQILLLNTAGSGLYCPLRFFNRDFPQNRPRACTDCTVPARCLVIAIDSHCTTTRTRNLAGNWVVESLAQQLKKN